MNPVNEERRDVEVVKFLDHRVTLKCIEGRAEEDYSEVAR